MEYFILKIFINKLKKILIISFLLLFNPSLSFPEDSNYYIHRLETLPFAPSKSLVLVESGLGIVKRGFSEVVLDTDFKNSKHALVGFNLLSLFNEDKESLKNARYASFIFIGKDGNFYSIDLVPIKKSLNELPLALLNEEVISLESEVEKTEKRISKLESDISDSRKEASKVAKVDEIIGLKLDLAKLTGVESKIELELTRLKKLVSRSYSKKKESKKDFDKMRAELGSFLEKGAMVTAKADKISRRRKRAALNNLKQKLRIIKKTSSVDLEKLDQEVKRIKNIRLQLESRFVGSMGREDL